MTIYYFTSTGNCLSVAKAIGGELRAIPQMIKTKDYYCADDVIGLIFPIYGFGLPKIVSYFLDHASWQADYIFAIGTYGNATGAALENLKKYGATLGIEFNYLNSLIMVDNWLPGYSVESQLEKLPGRNVPNALAKIADDVQNRVKNEPKSSLFERATTKAIQKMTTQFNDGSMARSFIVGDTCTTCGICAKVCPTGNIAVTENVTFGEFCVACLGCIHNCPQTALHLKNEKSSARFRNTDVTLNELIASNNQT
jgi:ferredoxin